MYYSMASLVLQQEDTYIKARRCAACARSNLFRTSSPHDHRAVVPSSSSSPPTCSTSCTRRGGCPSPSPSSPPSASSPSTPSSSTYPARACRRGQRYRLDPKVTEPSHLPRRVTANQVFKGVPILNNLPAIPAAHSWLQFTTWSRTYGPLYLLRILSDRHVIVSTERIANDLLRERGALYSSRPPLRMGAELMSHNLRPVFLPYSDLWRKGRRLMHALTMDRVSVGYEGLLTEESVRVLRDLIREPGAYERWLERYTAGVILRLGYGKLVWTGEEAYVKQILEVVHTVERVASPGAYLVDTLPVLMWLPRWLAPFKREGDRLHRKELELFRGLLRDVEVQMQEGKVKAGEETFASRFLEKREEFGLSFDEGAYVIGTLFEAGAGTTAAAMFSFLLAMIKHPEAMRKLQEEVDEVCGDRIPTFEDMERLPRVRATIKETARWRPVTAGGFPHTLIKDDVYEMPETGEKMFLAAGSNVTANQWAIHREEALYPNGDDFIPERWLDPKYPTYKEPLTTYPNLQNYSMFGFGRRICPGQNIAERSLHLLTARIAWACDIRKARDASGTEIEYADYDYTAGFNVQPKKFDLELKPRRGREKIVEGEWQRVWGEKSRQAE